MRAILQQLQELVQQAEIPQKPYYLLRLNGLIKRLEDPQLKLAIIGNFNCGKSTFLNALLQQPMLSMSNIPTTAVPTWIDWDAPEGEVWIRVKGRDNTVWEMDEAGRQRLFRLTGTNPPEETGTLIDYLTTTTALLKVIEQVRISFPSRQGFQGFTLIDTPGVNPGAEADAGHILSTQDVLRDAADAAIILFPCYSAYTRQFSEFMEDNASHLMDDSVFILTKMDMVENPREQKQLVWFVRENLKKTFELEEPLVYACSAGMALDFCTSGNPEAQVWAEDFYRMVREIFNSLGQRRMYTAARRTSGLVMELMADLTSALEDQQKTLEQFLRNLETFSLEAFQAQVNAHTLNYSANAALRKLLASKTDLDQTVGKAKQELCRGIQEAVTWQQLNGFMERQGRKIVSHAMEQVIAQAKAVTDDYGNAWKKAFDTYEEALYNDLHTYNSFLDSIPGSRQQDAALDLPDTLMQIRMAMDASVRKARQKLMQPQKQAQKIVRENSLAAGGNLVFRMVGSLQDYRSVRLSTVEQVLNGLRECFCLCAMEAAEILSEEDIASGKLLGQLYKQTYADKFRSKQPDLDAYRCMLEAQLEKQRQYLTKLKETEQALARWTVKGGPEEG